MKKVKKNNKDELRSEYKKSDFSKGFVRGKYVEQIQKSSNIVVLNPEVAKAFPNEKSVNEALQSLIRIAKKTTHITNPSTRKKRQLKVE